MSGAIHKIGTSLSTFAIFIKDENPFVYSNLADIPGT